MKTDFDIIIAGASLAGSSAAIRLSASGLKVLLLDKSCFPRVKPCGEGLSMLGYALLKDLPCEDFLSEVTKLPYFGFRVIHSKSRQDLPQKSDSIIGFGIERNLLDQQLLNNARKNSSVVTVLGCAVTAVNILEDGIEVLCADKKYSASYLLAADGARSKIKGLLGCKNSSRTRDRYGLKCSMQLQSAHGLDRVHILVKRGFEIYITPVAPARLNLAVLGNRKIIGEIAQPLNLKLILLELEASLKLQIEQITATLVTGPLGSRMHKPFAERVLFVGDAAETFDPLGGMGMSHALWSAKRACEAIIASESSYSFMQQAILYAKEREMQAKVFRGFTRLAFLTIRHLSKMPLPLWGRLSESAERALIGNRNRGIMSEFISLVGAPRN